MPLPKAFLWNGKGIPAERQSEFFLFWTDVETKEIIRQTGKLP